MEDEHEWSLVIVFQVFILSNRRRFPYHTTQSYNCSVSTSTYMIAYIRKNMKRKRDDHYVSKEGEGSDILELNVKLVHVDLWLHVSKL